MVYKKDFEVSLIKLYLKIELQWHKGLSQEWQVNKTISVLKYTTLNLSGLLYIEWFTGGQRSTVVVGLWFSLSALRA